MYAHQDRLGSIHKLVDGSGATVETYRYGPYGDTKVYNGSGGLIGANSAVGNAYTWTGRRYDSETGLYYFRNRYYSPVIGRFLTEDPLGVWSDRLHFGNPYAYVGNAPLAYLDPLGLQVGGRAAEFRAYSNALVEAGKTGAAKAGQAAVDLVVPQTPADIALTLAGGPIARGASKAIGAVGRLLGKMLGKLGRSKPKGHFIEITDDVLPYPPDVPTAPKPPAGPVTPRGGDKDCPSLGDKGKPSADPPFSDPTKPPAPDWEWRGKGKPGTAEGAWYNKETGESLRPDLDHPPPILPHFDYKDPQGNRFRVFPDGSSQLKTE